MLNIVAVSLRHSGFNAYYGNAIWPHKEEGLKIVAPYIIRASFSQERRNAVSMRRCLIYVEICYFEI